VGRPDHGAHQEKGSMMYTFNFLQEVIHGDKYRAAADIVIDGEPTFEQAKFICENSCIIFCKTDYIFMLFEILLASKRKYILITHNSDYAIDCRYWKDRPENILRWYALNVAYKHPDLVPIPSGMERPLGCGYSSDATILDEQLRKPKTIKNLAYMNHNSNNNHGERDIVDSHFQDKPWVTVRKHGTSFKDFIDNCHSHNFVISPPGNGIDCHRTWEALYMGAIPIVKRSIITEAFVDLPILIVEDWTVITEEILHIILEEFKTMKFNCEKLTLSYWINRINADRIYLKEEGTDEQ
jgi:hypothetical protein